MITREDIVTEARKYIGVPWVHQGRSMAGIDCGGLVICVGQALGLLGEMEQPVYGPIPDSYQLRALCNKYLDRIPEGKGQPGDILLMRFTRAPQHLAIMTDAGIIHCITEADKVAEHSLDLQWRRRILSTYSFRGLD